MQKIWIYSRWCRLRMPQRQIFGSKGTKFFFIAFSANNYFIANFFLEFSIFAARYWIGCEFTFLPHLFALIGSSFFYNIFAARLLQMYLFCRILYCLQFRFLLHFGHFCRTKLHCLEIYSFCRTPLHCLRIYVYAARCCLLGSYFCFHVFFLFCWQ